MNVSVRRLTAGDEEMACRLVLVFKSMTLSPARAEQFLANPAHFLLVAEVAGELAGFVLAYRLERLDRPTSQLFIYELDVLPKHRRRRVGTRLMEFVRDIVNVEAFLEAFVFTNSGNSAAVALYGGTGGQVEDDSSVLFVYPGHAA